MRTTDARRFVVPPGSVPAISLPRGTAVAHAPTKLGEERLPWLVMVGR
jgi:hypothetical protein